MNAAERINDGASPFAAWAVEVMQVDDEITSILTPDCVAIDCVLSSFMKNHWAAAFARFTTTFVNNSFGHKCDMCEHLRSLRSLKPTKENLPCLIILSLNSPHVCRVRRPVRRKMVFWESFAFPLPTLLHREEINGLGIPLCSLWTMLHCRRVADKGYRVYPLDPPPDAVDTPDKHRAWFLSDDRHTASFVGHRGGWRHARTKIFTRTFGSNAAVPG
ncbi:uncharacterized protein TNCV_2408271 [Trichonephila clavipes]|nr:uncharacterized protein TNCV_2408271 [Trichonephila clavipes]